jgi:hypothetical protein
MHARAVLRFDFETLLLLLAAELLTELLLSARETTTLNDTALFLPEIIPALESVGESMADPEALQAEVTIPKPAAESIIVSHDSKLLEQMPTHMLEIKKGLQA